MIAPLILTALIVLRAEIIVDNNNFSPGVPIGANNTLPMVNLNDPKAQMKLVSALQGWGFSYISGHGIPDWVINEAMEETRSFFDLPIGVKRSIAADRRRAKKTARGYTENYFEQLDAKGQPDVKEVLDVGFVSKESSEKVKHYLGTNVWLDDDSGDRRRDVKSSLQNTTENFAEYASSVAKNLLALIANEFGCGQAFDAVFGSDALQVQRLTRYPPIEEATEGKKPDQIGAGVHTDYGGITVIYSKGPGLYILKLNRSSSLIETGTFSPELHVPNSDEWLAVDSIPGTLIVMAGESLQRLSNGQIYAVKHKVDYNGSVPRYSLAFFYDPQPEAIVEPLACFRKNATSLYEGKLAGHKGIMREP